MKQETVFEQEFNIRGGDYINGGEASCRINGILKDIGIDPDIILRTTVVSYEAEMNMVMYAEKGSIRLLVSPRRISLKVEDQGPGITDIEQAMRPGFSTATAKMREMGFGAGLGLPNIREHADKMTLQSSPGEGVCLEIELLLEAQ